MQAVRHVWALVAGHGYGVKIEEKHTLVFTMATTSCGRGVKFFQEAG